MKKKILSILLSLFLIMALVGCRENEGKTDPTVPKTETEVVTPSGEILVTESETTNYYLPILSGYKNLKIELSEVLELSLLDGLYALDYKGVDITNKITFDDTLVNYEKPGKYKVIYEVIDKKGGKTTAEVDLLIYDEDVEKDLELSIYQLNDLHGALLFNDSGSRIELGLANIANLIFDERKDKDILLVTSGDTLQGQAISNLYKGASIIHVMNEMEFDAFVIGNHEFDWGLDTVLSYFNGENELQANFPLLGANVFRKDTNTLPVGMDEYTIVEKNGIDVGIIGVMGYGLESSIDGSLVRDYYFADPIPIVRRLVNKLRNEENVDRVIVINHHDDSSFNRAVSQMDVDAIINGHTHNKYERFENGIPIIQSGSSGNYLGYIHLPKTGQATIQNLSYYDDVRLRTPDAHIKEIVDFYEEGIYEQLYTPILVSDDYYSRGELTSYIAKLMRVSTDSDIAFHNYGGTRTDLRRNEDLTEAKILEILPFDNMIITTYILGRYVNSYIYSYGEYNDIRPYLYEFKDNQMYKVAVHSYLYFMDSNPFMYGDDIEYLDSSIYQLFVASAKAQRDAGYTYFNTSNEVLFGNYINYSDVYYSALTDDLVMWHV